MKLIKNSYSHTISACITGYIIQAVVNNFVTLLFVYFRGRYFLTPTNLAAISAFNFFVQLTVDMLSGGIVRLFGCRGTVVAAHFFAGIGLVFMAVLPGIMPPFAALLVSSAFYAAGGGLIEVMISPIVESCPTPENRKASIMSLLHSFYCWGQLGVILISTLFFYFFGIKNWFIIAFIWSALPFLNAVYFMLVPIIPPPGEDGKGKSILSLLKNPSFRRFMVIMLCAGACELALAQWASAYAQDALGLSKLAGDVAVPCVFAAVMGISRIISSHLSRKINLEKYMLYCSAALIIGYGLAAAEPHPIFGIIGCAVCGYAVGVLWPGTYSVCAKEMPEGGIAMFSLLAFSGDVGCCAGPGLVGTVADFFDGNLKAGMLVGVAFSLLLFIELLRKK